jgi:hypothetical protein
MAAQKSTKPAAAETANGLLNTDRLGSAINPKNIKSKAQRQIRKPFDVYRPLRSLPRTLGGR